MIGGMDSFCKKNRKAVPKISAYIYFINFVTHRTGAEESQTGKDRKSMSFQGKTAVITGASSGIGLLCAQCFAEQGANIVMLATNPTKLQSKVDALTAKGYHAIGIPTDVRNYAQVADAFQKAKEAFSTIDIVINSAGGSEIRICGVERGTPFQDVPIEVFDWGLDVNLKGPFYMGHAAMKYMAEQKSGVIINIGSITGAEASCGDVAYATAKSGVMNGLTKSLALVGAPYGVRCCCVSPGPVLTRDAMANMKTLLGRAAEPQEIVDLIMYLASDKAAFITGENILIDGGRFIMKNKE